MGVACVDALIAEKDPVRQRYMRRLSDGAARIEHESRKKGEFDAPAHAELADECGESGPCKNAAADASTKAWTDDGYACLTKAERSLESPQTAAQSKRAHARACQCDPVRAQIPVMGGVLACDGPNKPVTRGKTLALDEARDIVDCGACDAEKGAKACEREIDRLKTKDADLVRYLEGTHVPRCRKP